MECPWCGQEMIPGAMTGDGRSRVFWETSEEKPGLIDRMIGKGRVESVTYTLDRFRLEAAYCPRCKKMIVDTEIGK